MLCKIWNFHSSDYKECRLLGYKTPVPTSQETHYVSATESSQLMLCKIWSFHSGDYEECRLLGYKNPVRTSQETHYVFATASSQLMLCKIWSFHSCDYEEWCLPGWFTVLQEPHGVTSQKMAFFIVTAFKTSDLTLWLISYAQRQQYLATQSKNKLHGS
jgi:hypothetical protein